MNILFAQGHAVDVVLVFMGLEFVWLIARGRNPVTVALTILPGACMMIALRAALTGAGWQLVALALTVSLPAHLADLRHRKLI